MLEGFLLRLSASQHAQRFVLKGGVLLAAYDLRRPTADIDFAARAISTNTEHVREIVCEIATLPPAIDNGIRFDAATARAESIREEEEEQYNGVRVTMRAQLATAVEAFHVDVNVGDPIWPAPRTVSVRRLLGGDITLLGYSMSIHRPTPPTDPLARRW